MMDSLNMATDGLLDRGDKPALAIASRGLLRTTIIIIVTPEPEVKRGGTGGGPGARYSSAYEKWELPKVSVSSRIIRDDNEVFEIIIIALESGLIE
jgi:hypothetical protein